MLKSSKKFVVKPTFSCDDLKQTSTRAIKYASDEHGPTELTVTTTLPPFVLPTYWQQYALSLSDLLEQSIHIPPKFYWLSALLFGVDANTSSIKASFASINQVLISAKPIAIDKIIKSEQIKMNQISNLALDFRNHKPPIPKVDLSREDLLLISKLIFTALKPFDVSNVKGFFTWKNKLFLPTALEEELILMNRVVLEKDYTESCKEQCFLSKPLLVLNETDNQRYALVEEVFLAGVKI